MTHITIIIALLAGIALGNATPSDISPVDPSVSETSISVDKVSKVEPPQEQAGGGEGGWPGF
ncbi:MAG: hypothetical protein AABN95_19025 [Acidobacteriota bacterium]